MQIDFAAVIAQLIFMTILFIGITWIGFVCYRKFGKKSETQKRIEQLELEVRDIKKRLEK